MIPKEQLVACVLPMFGVTRDAIWHAIGTGFVIARLDDRSALVVTAAHNLQKLEDIAGRRSSSHATTLEEFAPRAFKSWRELQIDLHFLLRRGEESALATVVGDAHFVDHDLAVLHVAVPPDTRAVFDTALPISLDPRVAPGTHIAAVGYAGIKATSTQDYEHGDFRASVRFPLESRDGSALALVTDELGIHRGRSGLMVDIPFDGGMSGGPVIELRGTVPVVRAIVSADVGEKPDGSVGSGVRSFASLLLPIAGLRLRGLRLSFPDGATLDEPSVLELMYRGQVNHYGTFRDAIQVFETDDKVTVMWSIEAQEG